MLIVGSSSARSSAVSLERQWERVDSALPVVSQPQSVQLIRRPVADVQRIEPMDARAPYREGFVFSDDDFRTQRALATYASIERLGRSVSRLQRSGIDDYA